MHSHFLSIPLEIEDMQNSFAAQLQPFYYSTQQLSTDSLKSLKNYYYGI